MLELKERISTIIQNEVKSFKEKTFTVDGLVFSQYNNIKRINLYINDQFLLRNADEEGLIFWNISNSRIIHFAKNIDLDTKDLMTYGKGNVNYWQSWILRLKFKKWLRDNHFSLTLNDLSEGITTYGSIIWKKYTDYKTKEVKVSESDLRRLYFNPKIKTVRGGNVVELHYLTQYEIREKEGAWDNVSEVLKKASRGDDPIKQDSDPFALYEIWERVGEVMGKDGKSHYMHYMGGGYGENEVIVFEEEIKPEESPYYDFHLGRYRGRWQRVGIPERLFKLQERANTVVNQNAESTQIASLLLMRSQDSTTYGNILQNAVNGQIINSGDLQQIGIDNRSFSILLGELDRIEAKADKLCMTPEIVTGDNKPSQVGFRGMATMANAAKSAFQYIRESIGESVANLMMEEILPSVVKKWNRGDIIEIIDDIKDVKMFDDAVIKSKQAEVLKKNLENGIVTTQEELDSIAQQVSANIEKVGRKIELEKGFFNFDFGLYLNVTGESADKNQQNDAYFNILQMIQANPAIQSSPYFRQYVENNGISPISMTTQEQQDQIDKMKQGQMGGAQPGGNQQSPQAGGDKLMATLNS